jgi:hypothetical protein
LDERTCDRFAADETALIRGQKVEEAEEMGLRKDLQDLFKNSLRPAVAVEKVMYDCDALWWVEHGGPDGSSGYPV